MAESRAELKPRIACARALEATLSGSSLDAARAEHFHGIAPARLALAREMLDGSVRWFFRLDWQIGQHLRKPLSQRDQIIRALLLLGLYQLQFMRTPAPRVVNESVSACRALRRPGLAGLVNAVLRKAARAMPMELPANIPASALHASPDWLISLLRTDWPDQYADLLAASNGRAPMTLRVNRLQIARASYLDELAAADIPATPLAESPGALLLAQPVPVATLPGFREGRVSVQDSSAQIAAELLAPRAGERILDACAAPGGKSAHLLEICPEMELTCLDVDARRLETLHENLARLRLRANTRVADAGQPENWWDGEPFDRILLDAPCSATGVIRRHPDIRLLRRQNDIAKLAEKQRKLLLSLWKLLKPGGRMLYATCSLLRAENEAVVTAFLQATDDARPLTPEVPDAQACPVGCQRFPTTGGGDGFYYCLLEKV